MRLSQMLKGNDNPTNTDDKIVNEFDTETNDVEELTLDDVDVTDVNQDDDIDMEIQAEIDALSAIGNPEKTPVTTNSDDEEIDAETQAELDAMKAIAGI